MSGISLITRIKYWYMIFEYHSVSILIYSIVLILIASATLTYNKAVSEENALLKEENEQMLRVINTLMDRYMIEKGKYILASSQLQPFKEIARKMYPDSNINSSLIRLNDDLVKSRFTPLDKEVMDQVVFRLKKIKQEVGEEDLFVKITFEPWAEPDLIRFAEQIKVMLYSVGLHSVVESNNVYLFELPVPVEWGGNTNNNALVEKFIDAFEPVFSDVSDHKTRISKRFPKDYIRMHIAGYMKFEPSGIVSIQ